jgi:hypothetical protein
VFSFSFCYAECHYANSRGAMDLARLALRLAKCQRQQWFTEKTCFIDFLTDEFIASLANILGTKKRNNLRHAKGWQFSLDTVTILLMTILIALNTGDITYGFIYN